MYKLILKIGNPFLAFLLVYFTSNIDHLPYLELGEATATAANWNGTISWIPYTSLRTFYENKRIERKQSCLLLTPPLIQCGLKELSPINILQIFFFLGQALSFKTTGSHRGDNSPPGPIFCPAWLFSSTKHGTTPRWCAPESQYTNQGYFRIVRKQA